jgi:formiminoglutamase
MVKDKIAEIRNFFDPIQLKDFEDSSFLNNETALGNSILINSAIQPIPINSRFELAIICVDGYLTRSNSKQNTVQQIREELYKLKKIGSGLRIADFGNLKKGANLKETIFALQEVCSMFFYSKIKVVIIGGAQLLTIGAFRALKEFENNINLVHIDSKIDISSSFESAEETDYLSKIMEQDASHIYNISAVGYQSYYVDSKQINKINESFFDHYRLGEIRSNFENIEPVLRDADLVSFDISAIRMSEAPGQSNGSPNGFYADEACRLSRYAGISDRKQAFGLFEIETHMDKNRQTVKLSAQILWYFLMDILIENTIFHILL